MDKDYLNLWFDTKFLTIYQNATKVEHARRLLHRYQPDEKTLEKIVQFVLADNRRRRVARDRKEFYAQPPNCFTFFNESRWMDQIKETAIVEEKEEQERLKCPHCRNFEYPHMDNKNHLCSWHFSKEHYSDGLTGLKVLRDAYTKRIPQLPEENITGYLKRVLKTKPVVSDKTEGAKPGSSFKDLEDEWPKLEKTLDWETS